MKFVSQSIQSPNLFRWPVTRCYLAHTRWYLHSRIQSHQHRRRPTASPARIEAQFQYGSAASPQHCKTPDIAPSNPKRCLTPSLEPQLHPRTHLKFPRHSPGRGSCRATRCIAQNLSTRVEQAGLSHPRVTTSQLRLRVSAEDLTRHRESEAHPQKHAEELKLGPDLCALPQHNLSTT